MICAIDYNKNQIAYTFWDSLQACKGVMIIMKEVLLMIMTHDDQQERRLTFMARRSFMGLRTMANKTKGTTSKSVKFLLT